MSTGDSERERGRKEGRIDAQLDEHTKHLEVINGSIERSASALESVAKEVRDLGVKFDMQIKMAEAARVALAEETERRRIALADVNSAGDRTFTRSQAVAALLLAVIASALTLYFSVGH